MRAFQQAATALQNLPGRGESTATQIEAASRSLAELLRRQPAVVVAGESGNSASAVLPALLYRWFRRETRLLVWSDGVPPIWRWTQRLALHLADGVLVRTEADADAVSAARKSDSMVFTVPGPYAIADYLGVQPVRSGDAARRIIVSGALAPGGDAIAIQQAAVHWAEQHPGRRIEICWIGDGHLRHVLAAQSLPANLMQCFPGELTAEQKRDEFARSGVMIVAATAHDTPVCEELYIAEAMACGLVVLFDGTSANAARIVQAGLSGIGFDGAEPASLLHAIAVIMDSSESALDTMRCAARMRILPMDPMGFAERFERALAAVMRGTAAGRGATQHVAEAQ